MPDRDVTLIGTGITRRAFLTGSSGALIGFSWPMVIPTMSDTRFVVFRPGQEPSRRFAMELSVAGLQSMPMDGDMVRFWRRRCATLFSCADSRLYGLSGWTDFLILRGLAAELRRHPIYVARHNVACDGVRPKRPMGGATEIDADWVRPIAALTLSASPRSAAVSVCEPVAHNRGASWFSWIFGS